MAKLRKADRFATKAVHAGIHPDKEHGSVNPAIHLTTTYVQPAPAQPLTYDYARAGNPTRTALEEAIAVLEGGVTGHAFTSGLSALDAILRTLDSGDHVVAAEDAYGGSIRLLNRVFARHGVKTTFVDTQDPANTRKAMTKATKLVLMETPTNPLLRVSDIQATAEVAHDGKALLVVDNTFMSPALQLPLKLGADVVFHSATKYIGGHSDVLAGVVACRDEELGERLRFLQMAVGAVCAPFDCYLLLRGLRTLQLRMERHGHNASIIAKRLAERGDIETVHYPGLQTHPGHEIHARQALSGGGMLSFAMRDGKAARKLVTRTRLWTLAES